MYKIPWTENVTNEELLARKRTKTRRGFKVGGQFRICLQQGGIAYDLLVSKK